MKLKFFKNAVILTATGFLLRGLGMVFRVYISARIGEEGMGVYQLITSAYFLFITLAQSGLAVTVTRLCAKHIALCDKRQAEGVLKSGLKIALFCGSFACLAMLLLSGIISRYWIGDLRAVSSLRMLSFSLPFIALCSVLSGYFIANKNVSYGCIAQILEQISRLAVAAFALYITKNKPLDTVLCSVVFANTLSEGISCLYLGLRYALSQKSLSKPDKSYKKEIIRGATPVALSRYLASALHTAENMLVPSAMTMYYGSRAAALAGFGALKGMALPLLFFPFSFLSALSTLLVPEITDTSAKGSLLQTQKIVKRTCFLTLTLSIMASGAFFLFSEPLGILIYKSKKVSYILKCLSPLVPFMYLDSICDGLLKGLGKQKQVLFNNCIDSAVRIILTVFLVPAFGLNGFLLVMAVSNIMVSLLNFRLLLKTSFVKCDFLGWWIMPFCYCTASAIITKFLIPFGASFTKILVGCTLFCLIFGCFGLIFGQRKKFCKNN